MIDFYRILWNWENTNGIYNTRRSDNDGGEKKTRILCPDAPSLFEFANDLSKLRKHYITVYDLC